MELGIMPKTWRDLPLALQQKWLECAAQVIDRMSLMKKDAQKIAILGDFPLLHELSDFLPQANIHRALSNDTYDLIVHWNSLHEEAQLPQKLAYLLQSLNPGGFFLAGFWGGDTLIQWRQLLIQRDLEVYQKAYQRIFPFVRLSDTSLLLKNLGFHNPVADRECWHIDYGKLQDLIYDLHCFAPQTSYKFPVMTKPYYKVLQKYFYKNADQQFPITLEWIWLAGWRFSSGK